jgi:hypothetical protein
MKELIAPKVVLQVNLLTFFYVVDLRPGSPFCSS